MRSRTTTGFILTPLLLVLAVVPSMQAQDLPPADAPESVLPAPLAAVSEALQTLPALTPVIVKLEEEISSRRHKPGDHFRISVAEAVKIGDMVVIPAGASGEGEVIHATKAGAGGKAGELILAARYVKVGDTEIRLRSFTMGAAGKDNTNGALAASFVLGPLAMIAQGGAAIAPLGALGTAKTAVELGLPAQTASETPPQLEIPSSPQQEEK